MSDAVYPPRLPEESALGYDRFLYWLSCGIGTTVSDAYNAFEKQNGRDPKVGVLGSWQRMARDHKWEERSEAYKTQQLENRKKNIDAMIAKQLESEYAEVFGAAAKLRSSAADLRGDADRLRNEKINVTQGSFMSDKITMGNATKDFGRVAMSVAALERQATQNEIEAARLMSNVLPINLPTKIASTDPLGVNTVNSASAELLMLVSDGLKRAYEP